MAKVFRKLVTMYTKGAYGRKSGQSLFEWLYRYALRGMNYGEGGATDASGEMASIAFVKDQLRNTKTPLVLFDVGANIGKYAKGLDGIFSGVQKEIHCFEPSAETFRRLSENVNGYKDIKLNNFGMGNENATLKLYTDKAASGLASVFKRNLEHFSMEMGQSEDITIKTIDGHCSEKGITHIHLLKLDIEGNELNALKGAKDMIAKGAIDFIQFEFGGCNIDSRTYFQDFYYLLSPHFKLYRILGDGPYPVTAYREEMEIFITTNYLAQRKS